MNKKELIILLIFLISFGYFFQRGDDNISSHLFPIFSFVDYGTLNIDNFHKQTNDKSFYKGHFYSDKAPGLLILGIPIYGSFKFAIQQLTDKEYIYSKITYILTFILISLPSAVLGIFIFRFLGFFIKKETTRLFLISIYLFGTPAFPYSMLFYGHQIAASFLFISFYLIFIQFKTKSQINSIILFISGFLAGFAVIVDYPSFIITCLLLLYLLAKLRNKFNSLHLNNFKWKRIAILNIFFKKELAFFLVGITIPLILLFIYNRLCFENIFSIGYNHVTGGWAYNMKKGFMGITFPTLKRLYGITLSPYRGLFFISPVLLLVIPGFYYFYKIKGFKEEFYLCLFSALGFIIFNASYVFWWGGEIIGPRHLVNMLPFMIIPVGICIEKIKKLTISLGLLSILTISIITITSPQIPSGINNPFFQYSIPNLIKGNITANWGHSFGLSGIFSLIPGLILIALFFSLLVSKYRTFLNVLN